MFTPWGASDHSERLADGITFYGTPSHGGIKLSPDRQADMPAALRREAGWYEEDCEYALVYLAFPDEFTRQQVADAIDTVKQWYPDEYEAWSGHKVTADESYIVAQREFNAEHADDLIVVCAWGASSNRPHIPEGQVECIAQRGGRGANPDAEERRFMVLASEYRERSSFGFVIDPDRHPEWVNDPV